MGPVSFSLPKKTPFRKIVDQKIVPIAHAVDDGLSLVQYSLLVAQRSAPTPWLRKEFFEPFSFMGMALAAGFGGYQLKRGIEDYTHAGEISDVESKQRAEAKVFSGAVIVTSAASSLLAKVIVVCSAIFSRISDFFFGIGAFFSLGMSTLGIYRSARFLYQLNKAEDQLQFLFEKAILTPQERENALDASNEEAFQQKMNERAEAKMRYFKRRTSGRVFHSLLSYRIKMEEVKEGLDPSQLISEVRKAAIEKIVLFALAFATATVALAALGIGTFCSAGIIPFILYAIASSISFVLVTYTLISKAFSSVPDLSREVKISN